MRIEAKTKFKCLREGKHYDVEEKDQLTVPDTVGNYWTANGWAINLETGEEVPPSTDPLTLDIHNSKIGVTNTEV